MRNTPAEGSARGCAAINVLPTIPKSLCVGLEKTIPLNASSHLWRYAAPQTRQRQSGGNMSHCSTSSTIVGCLMIRFARFKIATASGMLGLPVMLAMVVQMKYRAKQVGRSLCGVPHPCEVHRPTGSDCRGYFLRTTTVSTLDQCLSTACKNL